MEVMGIKFAPLNVPLKRRLQTLAAGAAAVTGIFCPVLISVLFVYIIFCTSYWPLPIIYSIWAYVIDRNYGEQGGRRIEWVCNWMWWKYLQDYFSFRLRRVPGVELDPKKNYLFCYFPHGLLPLGWFSGFASNWGGFRKMFPNHIPYPITLKQAFYFPLYRDLLLAVGACSATKKSLNWILGSPTGGKVGILVIGGAAEAFCCNPGDYRILLKHRKGFIKIALHNGTPLVPVFSFGEIDIYGQASNPEGSLLRRVQEFVKAVTGFVLFIPLGRGLFQYSFGLVPFRKPISTIIGKPIDVKKVEQPTQEQIDALHELFSKRLIELFEEQKHNYLSESKGIRLIIE